jgi:hypothetical protein
MKPISKHDIKTNHIRSKEPHANGPTRLVDLAARVRDGRLKPIVGAARARRVTEPRALAGVSWMRYYEIYPNWTSWTIVKWAYPVECLVDTLTAWKQFPRI